VSECEAASSQARLNLPLGEEHLTAAAATAADDDTQLSIRS